MFETATEDTTTAALLASIAHWREVCLADSPYDVNIGVLHCALCSMFYDKGCYGCPVSSRTGDDYCGGSPYSRAHSALSCWLLAVFNHPDNTCLTAESARATWRKFALEEIAFLESLLPSRVGAEGDQK